MNSIRPALDAILVVERVVKKFHSIEVLRDVDLTVKKGETVAIIGPSGSGKTTLLRCINFLTQYDCGRIFVNGHLIGYRETNGRLVKDTEKNVNAIRKRIGMVFQRFNLFPHRSVIGNLLEGPIHVLKLSRPEAMSRALEALRLVGLQDKHDAYPEELSGGQQQRVGIARALCMKPDLMLFDEVTSALDPELVGEVLAVMNTLVRQGMTMLVVTHELAFARDAADRMVFMEKGRIIADMETQDFFHNPPTQRIESYLKARGAE
jgi:polar amino acid transport system ATP-binding protein